RPAIPAGERHATLTRYAGRLLGKGHAPAEVHELLAALNVAKCQPSLPPTEVAQIVTDLAAKDEAKLTRSHSLRELLANPAALQPPAPIVPGLAWAGRLTLVAAREGVGKSTLFAAVAAAVTTGGEFLGERCVQGTVLWVLVEEHQ